MAAGIDLDLKAIIGLVIGLLAAIAIVSFYMTISGILTPVADEGTINNFNVLYAKIESFI